MTTQCRDCEHHRLSGVLACLSADVERFLNKSPENQAAGDCLKSRLSALLTPQLMAVTVHRAAHWLHVNGLHGAARLFTGLNYLLHRVRISSESCIGPGLHLPHPAGVSFDGVAGRHLTLYSLSFCGPREDGIASRARPQLGHRVSVGGHAVVIGPVRVGNDVKIAPCVALSGDAASGVMVVSRALRPRRVSLERITA